MLLPWPVTQFPWIAGGFRHGKGPVTWWHDARFVNESLSATGSKTSLEVEVIRVCTQSLVLVEVVNLLHLFSGQLEIEELEILPDP